MLPSMVLLGTGLGLIFGVALAVATFACIRPVLRQRAGEPAAPVLS
ncbi:hypothetical protein [Micromonospora palythoicola]